MAPARLRDFLKKLRRDWPTPKPVRVRQRPMFDEEHRPIFGMTTEGPRSFHIVLHSTPPEAMMLDTLVHEWAHAATFDEGLEHGPRWAKKYAAMQRWLAGEREYRNVP